jgi:hypothetical protein
MGRESCPGAVAVTESECQSSVAAWHTGQIPADYVGGAFLNAGAGHVSRSPGSAPYVYHVGLRERGMRRLVTWTVRATTRWAREKA